MFSLAPRTTLFPFLALGATLALGCNERAQEDQSGESGLITTSVGTSLDGGATMGTPDLGDDGTATASGGDGDGGSATTDSGGAEDSGEAGSGECTGGNLPTPNASLVGTVYSPSLEIPISGALVFLTDEAPDGIPDGTFCAECVEVPCGKHHILTAPDGSFNLPAVAAPGQKLVVTKGQFMRVLDIDVAEGTTNVSAADSSLPGEWNPAAGMWIPRIGVYNANPDEVYNVLAKFGMGTVSNGTLVQGTERFDLIDPGSLGAQILDNPDLLANYHIIFLPCQVANGGIGALTDTRVQNIRNFVEAGGKLYVTDHANEYIYQSFPSYQTMHQESTFPDLQPAYDVIGNVADADLLAWLQALPPGLKNIGQGFASLDGLPGIELVLNYSGIDAVHDVIVQDDEGEDVNVGHHVWVEGPCTSCDDGGSITRPMGISGTYGCGRMMYTTYESSSTAHTGLSPQELVLLYMILEIGVCFGEPPPPPPPVP